MTVLEDSSNSVDFHTNRNGNQVRNCPLSDPTSQSLDERTTQFRSEIASHGANALNRGATVIASKGVDELLYIPFEHVESRASLVLVGITPGRNQLRLAYDEARRRIRRRQEWPEIIETLKRVAAFGGAAMRPNLLRMLRHFQIASLIGVVKEEDLWGRDSALLNSTSVIPHAAFRRGKRFAGSFEDLQNSTIFNPCFMNDFVPTLASISSEARYIALGPTVQAALRWCVERGFIEESQLLGAFPHPSTSGGSQVGYFLREKTIEELKAADPVRHRTTWLDDAYQEISANISAWSQLNAGGPVVHAHVASGACEENLVDSVHIDHRVDEGVSVPVTPAAPYCVSDSREIGLSYSYTVRRGRDRGIVLKPHVHEDGCYVVSKTRFERDYVRVQEREQLATWLERGYKLRMSAVGRSPSLISPESIKYC